VFQNAEIDKALRVDSYILLENDLKQGTDKDVVRAVSKYRKQNIAGSLDDSNQLLHFMLSHSEDKLQVFFDENFSNIEIGMLSKLR
jgi:hypothetical protein